MKIDLERALHDIAGAATHSAPDVAVDRVLRRAHRRRAAVTAGTTVAGAGAAGAVVLATTTLGGLGGRAAPTGPTTLAPAGPAVAPTPEVPSPDPDPVAGWVAGEAPCGEQFTLEPVDNPYVEITGRAVHGSPDERNWFTPGLGEDWVGLYPDVQPDVLGEILDHDAAPETTSFAVLVDAAGTVAAWSHPDEPIREFTDGSGTTNAAGLYDAVDCRTGQPLAGEYRVYGVLVEGSVPRVGGELGPRDEVEELAPLAFGVGQDQTWTWDSSEEWAPRVGDTVEAGLARGPEPELVVEVDAEGLEVNAAGVSGTAVLRSLDEPLTGVVPQDLRAFLVGPDGRVAATVEPASYPSAREVDLANGVPVEVLQWWGIGIGGTESTELPVGVEYDLYVWDVVPATGPDGVRADRLALSEPVRVTLQPGWVRRAG